MRRGVIIATLLTPFIFASVEAKSVNLSAEIAEVVEREVSAEELRDIKTIRKRLPVADPTATSSEVEGVERSARAFLDLELPLEGEEYGQKFVRALGTTIRILAYCAESNAQKAALLRDVVEHLNESEILNNLQPFRHSSYTEIREVPRDYLYAQPYLDGATLERYREGVKHLIEFEYVERSREQIRGKVSSDYIFLMTPHLLRFAATASDDEQAVRDMRCVSHFISAATQYADGGNDILKVDGTGFHHNTHYNGYMYSFNSWVTSMWMLRGTEFRAEREAYERLKKAVVSVFLMATCSDRGSHLTANSLAGRHPLAGMSISSDEQTFNELLEVGADLSEGGLDEDLAAYYNYFFKSSKYRNLPTQVASEQYCQFNYSPIGVYRKDDWVATMRSPTTKFWGAEIYNTTNRFGRYQSHGTLEIVYEGKRERSGYVDYSRQESRKLGGWDWNVMPGATTVHYTDWVELMPNRNEKDRFDQFAKTTTFSGALAWGKVGLFGAEFDQGDTWGGMRYKPTNLSYKKSVFAIDGVLISLGSEISSQGEYSDSMITATNLFQAVEMSQPFIVNGKQMKRGAKQFSIDTNRESVYLLTPQTTGYIIPRGNGELVLFNGEQSAPSQDAKDLENLTTRRAAKSYINHGVKVEGCGYEFVVVPASTESSIKTLYNQVCGSKNSLYEVLSKSGGLHALRHFESGIVAYSAFEAQSGLGYGYVVATGSEMLLMERYDDSSKRLSLALCNPNLRPKMVEQKLWVATPTETSVTLKGVWRLSREDSTVKLEQSGDTTTINMTLADGAPLYLDLER